MFFREKMQSPAPTKISVPAFFSALKQFWIEIFPSHPTQDYQNQPTLSRDFPKEKCAPELRGLLGTLQSIRGRILAGIFLGGWTAWSIWILIALLVVMAISAKLAIALILAAILATAGAAAILVWTWRTRISTYQTACRLDSAAHLEDRVSTALYLGDSENPGGIIERQRGDALARIAKVDPRGLFPLRAPVAAGRALVLLLLAAGLFVYRLHHKPPLVALLQTTVRSPLVQSVLSPLVNAMEKDLQRTLALVTSKPETPADQARPGEPLTTGDDLWQSSKDNAADAKEGQQDSLDAGDGATPQDQTQPGGNQTPSPSSESQQEGNDSPQSQNSKNSGDTTANNSQQQSGSQGSQNSKQSLSQSLMQALKNMMSSSPSQQASDRGNQQPQSNSQGAPQSGDSQQPGASNSSKKGDSRGTSDAKQNAAQSASNGAGSQQGLKEMRKDADSHPVNAVPDRVALEASGFKEQTRMQVDTDTGAAQLAVRDVSPQAQAVINGAEQENIPARYRLYVQRYFEHADNGKP